MFQGLRADIDGLVTFISFSVNLTHVTLTVVWARPRSSLYVQTVSYATARHVLSRRLKGHSTGQTTGIGGHMSARFIPTVERESIDLV